MNLRVLSIPKKKRKEVVRCRGIANLSEVRVEIPKKNLWSSFM